MLHAVTLSLQTGPEQPMHPPFRGHTKWRMFAYGACVTFLIAACAFFNRYPLVFSDSGTYIRSAFTLEPPPDRPIGYSLIIRAVTWQSTLWTVVLFQAAMLAWLLWETLKKVLPARLDLLRSHLVLVLGLVLFTSMPWYAAQIMPDIFSAMVILVLYLLFRAQELGKVKRAFLWTCLFFFLITHNSHVAMAALLLIGLAVFRFFRRQWAWPRFWANWGGTAGVLVLAVAFVSWYNGQHGLRYTFSPASNVFLSARLCENRMLGDFLDEHCGDRAYPLCGYKDQLPMLPAAFIWGDNSINWRMSHDMAEVDSMLAPMVHDFFLEPGYVGRFLRSSVVACVAQLFQVGAVSGATPYLEGSAPYREVADRLPWELSSYANSMQAKGAWWDTSFNDRVARLTVLLALGLIAWAGPLWRPHPELRLLIPLLLAWVVLNAVVTASLANVYDRLQSRVAWLVVLAACLVLAQSKWCKRVFGNPVD